MLTALARVFFIFSLFMLLLLVILRPVVTCLQDVKGFRKYPAQSCIVPSRSSQLYVSISIDCHLADHRPPRTSMATARIAKSADI